MKPKVIVEINGIRHKMVKSRVGGDLCKRCSLFSECNNTISNPCIGVNTYFMRDKSSTIINKKLTE